MPKQPKQKSDIDSKIDALERRKKALEIQRDIKKLREEQKKLRGK